MEQYFPDMKPGEIPERDFMFKVLSTLRTEEVQNLVKDARKQRSIVNKNEKEDLIEIHRDVKEELFNLFPQKSK